ncbi:MAG TPA: glycosyltransferase, partial [Bacteroidales bacterium]|nr:glycosyltransferase [Bacteroidales bacterium]
MYILHLPSWTPNENDPLNGNFIDKQIEAISLYAPSITLRLIKDKTKNHTEINKNNPQNIVITKYLKASFWDKIIGIRQLRLYLKGRKSLSAIINQHGKPAFIHLHVAYPYGVIAVDVAKSLHIPLILSEHWSAYLTHFHANKKDDFSPFQRSLIRSVFRNIRGFSAVSHFLL